MKRWNRPAARALCAGLPLALPVLLTGCAADSSAMPNEIALQSALRHYAADRTEQLATPGAARSLADAPNPWYSENRHAAANGRETGGMNYPTLGTFALTAQDAAQSQPAGGGAFPTTARAGGPPEGYWRQDIWHQMGHESLDLLKHDFWHGYKVSFWNLENMLVLTTTMGASIAIRETGVDTTIANRIKGHRQLGDMDETIQIIGNPGTQFAATGVLWLGTALTHDMKDHEVAKSLTQALAVTGATTILLKVACNTSSPDDERYGWPSGHTSSSFAFAAVVNEYYGPWVGVPALALAGLVGYQRLDSRVHDFSDVVFGGVLGYVIGTSIARDNKAQFPELFGMKVIPFTDPQTGASGVALMKGIK